MRSAAVITILLVSSFGCSGPAEDADAGRRDAGSADAGTGSDAGGEPDAGAEPDPDAGSDAGSDPDAGPGASVEWITVTEPQTLDGDIALDFGFQYEVVVDDPFAYTISMELCTEIAGMEEDCYTDELGMALAGTRFLRTGIDPGIYAVGENRYRWRAILSRGGAIVDDDVLELVVTVTSCETCIGGPGEP